jgi:L-ascorbate metabolism protein UlaG (beta-lactamase superfamily)
MKIKWLGHSCFLLTSSNGIRILTDPFNEQVGYPLPREEADIVTTSHDHFDHNNIGIIRGNFKHIKDSGSFECGDIEIKGISTFHDDKGGIQRGKNTVFVYSIDGINVCHLGDLGHCLSEVQVKEIGRIDVLLVPIGGVYTIDSNTAVKVIKSLNPKISIPMHYKTGYLLFELDGAESFLAQVSGKQLSSNEITIDRDNLSEYPEVIALSYI